MNFACSINYSCGSLYPLITTWLWGVFQWREAGDAQSVGGTQWRLSCGGCWRVRKLWMNTGAAFNHMQMIPRVSRPPRPVPVPARVLSAEHPAASIHARTSATMAADAWNGEPARRYPSIVWAYTIISRVYFGNKTRSKNNKRARERIPPPPAVPPPPPCPHPAGVFWSVRASGRHEVHGAFFSSLAAAVTPSEATSE